MIDVFDIIAFVVFGVLLVAVVVIVVGLGSLPGRIARSRGHPQAAAVSAASWLGLATGGILWPLALIWPSSNRPRPRPPQRRSTRSRSPRPLRIPTPSSCRCRRSSTR
jgi:hypothetical protein